MRGCDLVGSLCDPGKGGGLGGGISSQGSRQGPGAWGRDLEAAVRKLKTCVPPVEESCLHFINSQGQSFLDTNRQAMGLGQKPDVLRLRDLQRGIPPATQSPAGPQWQSSRGRPDLATFLQLSLGRIHGFKTLPQAVQPLGRGADQTLAAGCTGSGIGPYPSTCEASIPQGKRLVSQRFQESLLGLPPGALCSPWGLAHEDNVHPPFCPRESPGGRLWRVPCSPGLPVEREQAFFPIPSLSLTHMFIQVQTSICQEETNAHGVGEVGQIEMISGLIFQTLLN